MCVLACGDKTRAGDMQLQLCHLVLNVFAPMCTETKQFSQVPTLPLKPLLLSVVRNAIQKQLIILMVQCKENTVLFHWVDSYLGTFV